ncbi:15-hydroxyprostaglandin dehydrogenase [NAD(+)] [Manduca sexta]|uniref:Alcohol dehydrogenase n=1 Tax=Manduca sexta TaxID=7130 RepID=A0A921ZQ79_MANSE|nr:15-hydroxyprostaglandin dehydrogenase [NAD(+)] [Manduca sexta]KAG6461819.1 hypothetical protein O3G_MSEX012871 [Manduca sexta]
MILLDINQAKGEEAANTLNAKYGKKAVFIKCDVTKDLDVVFKQIIDTYKNIDVLVNNAGVSDENSATRTISINVAAVMEWGVKFWEHMHKDKGGNGGTIINMGSLAGFLVSPFLIYYGTSKFAVLAFTKSLGHEYNYKRSGVRVVAMCPGFTHTTLTTQQLVWDEHLDDYNKLRSVFPWQQSEDVAKAAVEVFEKAPSGTAWVINGGQPICEAPDCAKITVENIEKPETIVL